MFEEDRDAYENLQETVKIYEALQRLYKNKDFKKVFMENYLEKEALRLVYLKGANIDEKRKQNINNELEAIANFRQYMFIIDVLGKKAKEDLREMDNDASYEMEVQ